MLKRKRSFLAGGLTSSCRIKAEALARAFNSRIWPCTWRSVRDVRQEEDEEFYEASSADEDCGGRDVSDPCLTITSEQGRAKFCELLHAVDDATDVFYDVSENVGLSEVGKVSEYSRNPIHEVELHGSGEKCHCAESCEKSVSVCLNYDGSCEVPKDINCYNISPTEHNCQTSNAIIAGDKSSIQSNDSCEKSNVINSFTRSETEYLKSDDSCEISDVTNSFTRTETECLKTDDSCEISNVINSFTRSETECLKIDDSCAISKVINSFTRTETECLKTDDSCAISNVINSFTRSETEYLKTDDSCENSNVINSFTRTETECLKTDDSCEIFNDINMHEQSSTEYLYFKNNRDNAITCETSKDINDTNEYENLTSAGECMNNQHENNICDLVTNSQSINGAEKSINLDGSIECLKCQDFSDCPSEIDSGKAINKIDVSEEPIDAVSLVECFKSPDCVDQLMKLNSEEISKNENIVVNKDNFSKSYEILNDKIDDFLSPATQKSSENEAIEMRTDFAGDSAVEKIYNCNNAANINTSENLNNISNEILEFTNLPTIINKHSITKKMDYVNHDICSPNSEELLTVIIDSDSFEILQTPHNKLESMPSCTNQCLVEQSHTPASSDSSNSNNDQEAIDLPRKSDCPISTQETNEMSKDNDCVSNEFNFLELTNNDESHIVRLPECLNCNNDQEVISSSNETAHPISIEVTKDGNSPIYKNDCSKFYELECLENKIAGDDCRLKVFDEQRPMISRSTSLKTGKTPPGTPSRKKIVRFADVLGLDLEDVRHIISGDLPNIPSSAYSDLALAKESASPSTPQSNVVELSCRQQASWESVPMAVGPNALYPLFAIPGQQPDFMERLRSTGVCLESVVIEDCNVQCTCRVMNWGFNKRVLARITTNGWSSSSDINASYVSGSTRDGTDSFAFIIFLSRERSDLQFAIRYEINGNEYWDNNGGKNYCFSYHGGNASQTSVPCSPTWMEQFW